MGNIQQAQINSLEELEEIIEFKTYDSDGSFLVTEEIDVLYRMRAELQPVNMDMVRQFDKPLKSVKIRTKVDRQNNVTPNGNFIKDLPNGFRIPPYFTNPLNSNQINDTNEPVKALTGGRYIKAQESQGSGVYNVIWLETDGNTTILKPNTPISFAFNYYLTGDSGVTCHIPYTVHVAEAPYTISNPIIRGSSEQNGKLKTYDSSSEEWETYNTDFTYRSGKITTNSVNQWATATVSIPAYEPSSTSVNEIYVIIQLEDIERAESSGNFLPIYVDNFRVGNQNVEADGAKYLKSERRQQDANGVFTAEYEVKDLSFTNYKDAGYFTNYLEGTYKRERDTVGKSLEQIVTHEIINDNRNYLTKFEGTVKNNEFKKVLTMSNKIHVDFGSDVFKEPVSGVIDGMKFSLKKGEYYLNFHLPNQDDDTSTVFIPEFE